MAVLAAEGIMTITERLITVTIPVGPDAHHKRWLDECLTSIRSQTRQPDEVLLIDDMAGLRTYHERGYRVWRSPWRLGTAHAFNFGVALARHELVIMLGSDDRLEPLAVESCLAQYEASGQRDAYYYLPLHGFRASQGEYAEGHLSLQVTNAAMVTKGLWRATGGFPPESAIGPCDFIMMVVLEKAGFDTVPVRPLQGDSLYWVRSHDLNDTTIRSEACELWPHMPIGLYGRELCAATWRPPAWGRTS